MRKLYWSAVPALLLVCLAGCMKRKETITVTRDGKVTILLEYEAGSLGEIYEGDVVPSADDGWKVEKRVEKDCEGDDLYKFIAERSFTPDEPLPENFAGPLDLEAELYLQFPTTVTVEERRDGIYYHFHRIYGSRPWAQIEAKRAEVEELWGNDLEQIEKKDPFELTHDDRVTLIQTLVYMEYVKMQTFARWAFLDTWPQAPQDCWLQILAGLEQTGERLDFDHLAEIMAAGDEEEDNEALEAEAAAFEANVMEMMQSVLTHKCGYSLAEFDAFLERYRWHEKHYEITDDIGDEHFEIHVELPGEIIASNADAADEDEAQWGFDGKMLRDRIVELMVTSRVTELPESNSHDGNATP